jgi:hypothetical protein
MGKQKRTEQVYSDNKVYSDDKIDWQREISMEYGW